ncbi:5937_t:CDS:2 [Cetraspora pellucida]|uniref:5937_t:CDS:1 n=1 Tax=Cetraspora pellucida TaxID=1433469 RepID=A0ACA9K8W4_9GLOM|nr:5937_t:CDS:2 [Cetraspora pellucida]
MSSKFGPFGYFIIEIRLVAGNISFSGNWCIIKVNRLHSMDTSLVAASLVDTLLVAASLADTSLVTASLVDTFACMTCKYPWSFEIEVFKIILDVQILKPVLMNPNFAQIKVKFQRTKLRSQIYILSKKKLPLLKNFLSE